MKLDLELKKRVYQECRSFLDKKINGEIEAAERIQKSANAETKSSVGDKYETGRAMMHLEKEKVEIQLNESMKLKSVLDQIDINKEYKTVQLGSIIHTNVYIFFIGINCGEIVIDEKKFFTISLASPIGKVLYGKSTGDSFIFKNKSYKIIDTL